MERPRVEFEIMGPMDHHMLCKLCSSHLAHLEEIIEEDTDSILIPQVMNATIIGQQVYCLKCFHVGAAAIGHVTVFNQIVLNKHFIMKKMRNKVIDAKTNVLMGFPSTIPNYYICSRCRLHIASAAELLGRTDVNGYEGMFRTVVNAHAAAVPIEDSGEYAVLCDRCNREIGKIERELGAMEGNPEINDVKLNINALLKKQGNLVFDAQGRLVG